MADIDQFIKETNAEIKKLQDKQVSEAKKIVLTAYSMILDRSPVNTSLFKHNHFITVNSKTNATKEKDDNTADNKIIITGARYKNGDTITIQNNLKYADRLEAGHSSQAPSGVYGVTEQIIRRQIAKRIKIK